MSIVASELILYGSASRPEADTGTVGGAIDLTARPFDSDTMSADDVEAVSSNAGDTTQTLTVRYRDASGVIQSIVITLNGTTVAHTTGTLAMERLIEATLSATCAGTITLRKEGVGATQHSFAPGELKAYRMFISAVSGAAEKIYYEKVFFKNTNATLALQTAIVDCTADPAAVITVALEDAQNDNNSAATRLTLPTGLEAGGFVTENTDINVPGTNIAAASYIGVWVKMILAANNAAIKNTHTLRLRGQSV
jgi:hypothetical protein